MVIKPMSSWKNRHHLMMVLVLFVSGVLFAKFVVPNFRPDTYAKGLDIEETKGQDTAGKYWEEMTESGDLDAFVGYAYWLARQKKFSDAVWLADYASAEATGITKARALYLSAFLLSYKEKCSKVITAYGEALRAYLRTDSESGPFRTCVRISEAYLACGREDDARGMYRQALTCEPEQHREASNLLLVGALVTWGKDRAKALDLGEDAIQLCEDDRQLPRLWATIGRLHITAGNYQRGLDFTDKAHAVVKSPYVTINYLAHALCTGGDPSPWEADIEAAAETDDNLKRLLVTIRPECK